LNSENKEEYRDQNKDRENREKKYEVTLKTQNVIFMEKENLAYHKNLGKTRN